MINGLSGFWIWPCEKQNFTFHSPPFLQKCLYSSVGYWTGTQSLVLRSFSYWSACSPGPHECTGSRGTSHKGSHALLGTRKDRTGPSHSRFSLVVEHQVRRYLHILVIFNEVLASMDIYVQWQMHLPSNGKNLFISAAWSTYYQRESHKIFLKVKL